MKTRRENFKDKREEMRNKTITDCVNEITQLAKCIQTAYKKYNTKGKYLNICFNGNSILINNAYYGYDKEFPIDLYLTEDEYESL